MTDVLGVHLPAYHQVRLEPGDPNDLKPTEFRADAVVTLTRADEPILAIVIEAQLRRDEAKRWTWPVYLATLRSRLKCPSVLLVVCVDAATTAWSADPIVMGHPGWILSPLAIGPDQVPVIVEPGQAADAPELAVLSAMAHGAGPDGPKALSAFASSLAIVDAERAGLYIDVVLTALPAAAREYLEAMLTTRTHEYQSDFARRYFFEGKAEGEANALFEVLDTRKIDVTDDARERITACRDIEQLKVWVRRAVSASSVDDLFD